MKVHQIDCFKKHFKFLYALGIWPGENPSLWYPYYSKIFIFLFIFLFIGLYTVNFYFLPPKLEVYADEMIFYFTALQIMSKCLAFGFKRDEVKKILDMLESDIFQSNGAEGLEIIEDAKKLTILYWKITAGISYTANTANVLVPLLLNLILSVELQYPVCNYSFIPEKCMYPAYIYQGITVTSYMLYNVNLDTFLLGVMFLAIAQLNILDMNLRKLTNDCNGYYNVNDVKSRHDDYVAVFKIKQCIKHYEEIYKFCKVIQEAFSETLFVQFSLGAVKICACLFRFTSPAKMPFYIFLSLYMFVMTLQLLFPCWFATRIMDKSQQITSAAYDCNWITRSRQFKSNLRLLVERANKPLTIRGGKMFLLSLKTFTSIMNSAYSFFTVLRHMQTR